MTITMGNDSDYQTRNGLDVRILAVDAKGEVPVIALYSMPGAERDIVYRRRLDGTLEGRIGDLDIIERPRKFRYERWGNVYRNGLINQYATRTEADSAAVWMARIACVKVVIEGTEGDGL